MVSLLLLASSLPSGEKASVSMSPVCPSSFAFSLPVRASHRRMVLSLAAVAIHVPSGEKTTDLTRAVWPFSVCFSSPVCTSHSRTVLSTLTLASVFWSGEKATERTMSVCPSACGSPCRFAVPQLDRLVAARRWPAGLPSGRTRRRKRPRCARSASAPACRSAGPTT